MASTAVTQVATNTNNQTSASDDQESPFLRLAPELRNRIYKYTFTGVEQTGPVPHALTQTNRQIRSESRAMYYASIKCIKLNMRTIAQHKSTRRWVAEEDWSMFPVLPDFTFLTFDNKLKKDVTLSCHREIVVPKNEYSLQFAYTQGMYLSNHVRPREAMMSTYTKCLGFDLETYALGTWPQKFAGNIKSGTTWSVRRFECDEEDAYVYFPFMRLAKWKEGSEWTIRDLESVVDWMYVFARYRERQVG